MSSLRIMRRLSAEELSNQVKRRALSPVRRRSVLTDDDRRRTRVRKNID